MSGHLRRCRLRSGPHVRQSTLRCFAKREERGIDSVSGRREALSGARRRLATHLRELQCWKAPKGASGALLNRLQAGNSRTAFW